MFAQASIRIAQSPKPAKRERRAVITEGELQALQYVVGLCESTLAEIRSETRASGGYDAAAVRAAVRDDIGM
jgi:hypothetical protein